MIVATHMGMYMPALRPDWAKCLERVPHRIYKPAMIYACEVHPRARFGRGSHVTVSLS